MRFGKGPLGAIMDEYDRAADEYVRIVVAIDPAVYGMILDSETPDKECQSIQGICWQVLLAGYAYTNAIRKKFGIPSSAPDRSYPTHQEFPSRIAAMLEYSDETLLDLYSMTED